MNSPVGRRKRDREREIAEISADLISTRAIIRDFLVFSNEENIYTRKIQRAKRMKRDSHPSAQ